MSNFENLKSYLYGYNQLEERAKLFYDKFCIEHNSKIKTNYLGFFIEEDSAFIEYSIGSYGYWEDNSLEVPLNIFVSDTPIELFIAYQEDENKKYQKMLEEKQKLEEKRKAEDEYKLYQKLKNKFEN